MSRLGALTRHRMAAWLAVIALLIQTLLPLVDGGLHAAQSTLSDDALALASVAGPHGGPTAIQKPAPAHPVHECPICQFITALGNFAPPSATRIAAPVPTPIVATASTTTPPRPASVIGAAQPRAPPASI